MISPLKRSKFQDLNKHNTELEPDDIYNRKDCDLNNDVNLFFSICINNPNEWKEDDSYLPLESFYPCVKPKAVHVVQFEEDY
ncbi:hypothetical protein CL6EHI_c00148 [Entamoeba histolytica]|uniref:Uncharacterized protein n=1 Tax=Entamoeba histolytica TaxID=5759 RepID=A0A175JZE4_ENTHI|nr:hypothetical protein CL6EHI_c00148 [Entamoeba histolytica]